MFRSDYDAILYEQMRHFWGSHPGEQSVKNIAKPVRVYKVEFDAVVTAPIGSLEQPADLPLSDKPSIAVLPFTNLSNDPEQGYFSDGLTEDIITDLSKISGLFVIARNSTFIYKGQAVDIGEVSRRLGVRHVLEGSVRKAGNRVRINVQLIDAPTGGHVWAERYDRELADIFELQDEIRQKIVVALKITLSPREQARFRRAPTENLDAYDTYLRGLEQYYRRQKDTNIQARQLFEQAIALDAGYAAAYALLGFTAYLDFAWGWSDGPESLTRALELGHQAVGLDDRFAIGHCLLGYVYLSRRQYDRALAEAERAAVLDPNYADAYVTLGEVLIYVE